MSSLRRMFDWFRGNRRRPCRTRPLPARCPPGLETLEDRAVPAGSFLELPEFEGAQAQSLYVPKTGDEAGRLYVVEHDNGDVSVAYEQDLSVNDNTYGRGAIGWSHGHRFKQLVNSDKAEFRFLDGNGDAVLDFYLDYLSGSREAPSGYASLGATGGNGKMRLGSADWILDWDTSLANNLNSFKIEHGSTKVAGTNLLVNSPKADADYNPVNPEVFAEWDFHNWSRVRISAEAFGEAGFGSVSMGKVHNSPSKIGINAFTPELPPPPLSSECLTVDSLSFRSKTVTVTLTNTSDHAATIERLDLSWAECNGKLKKVKLDGATIHDKDVHGPSVSITDFKGKDARRTLAPGETVKLVLEFQKRVDHDPDLYTVVAFSPCSEPPEPQLASISGFVYADLSEDGVKDEGEFGLGDVMITLTGIDDQGNEVNQTVFTDADGFYRFEGLHPGTYAIQETQPDETGDGIDTIGTHGGETGEDLFFDIALSAGDEALNYNFGELVDLKPS